jgi:aminoglycoside phosphotransferase (APT) family kinase protein
MPNELDILAVAAALGLRAVAQATPTSGNSGAATWRVVHAGGTSAVRIFSAGHMVAVDREQRVMETARAAGLPVPAIERLRMWQDRPVMVLEWMRGRTVADELAARPWRTWHLGHVFGQMLAAIHQVPAPGGISTWLDWLSDDHAPLRIRLAALPQGTHRLLHLDYHPLNVLTDGERITGVLDWTNALAGEPRADVARTVTILRLDSGARTVLKSGILWLFEQGWRAGYRAAGGSLEGLTPFYAWAGAVMGDDLAAKRTQAELARVHAWTERWQRRRSR